MNFQSFPIHKALQEAMVTQGFHHPTPVQMQAIPAGLGGRDILASAQTGTGKTLAFLLPGLNHLLHTTKGHKPRLLILSPTRELAVQIGDEARKLTRRSNLRVLTIFGGASIKKQVERSRKGVDILVATPGRLLDLIRRRHIDLHQVEILVLDEADRMLDMGFLPDVKQILNDIPAERQTMLFSATLPQAIIGLANRFLKDPVRVEISTAKPPQAIEQVLFPVPRHLKSPLLVQMLESENVESALIFTRTKQEADIVNGKLSAQGFSVAVIHGDFKQSMRTRALESFRKGKVRILVATNVAARGLDIDGITHVINYDVPEEAENYIHRIGRTGRIDAPGVAWTLVTPEDEPIVHAIEHLLDSKIERKVLEGFDYSVPTPDWAKLSAETIIKRLERNQTSIQRWKSLAR